MVPPGAVDGADERVGRGPAIIELDAGIPLLDSL